MAAPQMVTGISAPGMASILHTANTSYTSTDIGQALSETYPLLTASSLVSILTGSAMFPDMGRNDLITLLTTVGYTQTEALNAVTAKFPVIQTGYAELSGTLGTSASDIVLSYQGRTMSYADAAYWYNQSGGPEVSAKIEDDNQGIFFIGNITVPRTQNVTITGQFLPILFTEPSFLEQQIICLMAYVLQYPYPPHIS